MQTLVSDVTTELHDDLIDEFDLDIRISVLPMSNVSAGFSTWQSCESCNSKSCDMPEQCLTTTTQGC